MPNGMFFAFDEAIFVELPCTLFSMVGGWCVHCETLDDLRAALVRHHREPGSMFALQEVLDWACERPGQAQYTANFPQSKHKNQGVMPGFETF